MNSLLAVSYTTPLPASGVLFGLSNLSTSRSTRVDPQLSPDMANVAVVGGRVKGGGDRVLGQADTGASKLANWAQDWLIDGIHRIR